MDIEETESMIEETFKTCCQMIIEYDLKDHEFEFAKRSILNFLDYFSQKRREKGIL